MVSKREFFNYISNLYDESYKDEDTYILFREILKTKDKVKLGELYDLTQMSRKERLAYRYSLAANGKELTPLQLDMYLSAIKYALEQRQS